MEAQFFRDGFTVLRGAAPEPAVADALRSINAHLPRYARYGFDGTLTADASVVALLQCPAVVDAVSRLLGPQHRFFAPAAQVALRLPGTLCLPGTFEPAPHWAAAWHVDGIDEPQQDRPRGRIANFTMLVGVALSDHAAPMMGNLIVYPGGHHVVQDHFRAVGFEAAQREGLKTLRLPLPSPHQVPMQAGDVVLAHYSLPHSIAPNCSAHVRYMVYFRLNVRADEAFHPAPLLDIWLDYPGVPRLALEPLAERAVRVAGYLPAPAAAAGGGLDGEVHFQKMLEQQRFAEALPLLRAHHAAHPTSLLVALQLGLCLTASPGAEAMVEGARVLERLAATAPMFAQAHVWLARNYARQVGELGAAQLRDRAVHHARVALLDAADDASCAREALQVLREMQSDAAAQAQLLQLARQRYPSADLPDTLGTVGASWVEGHAWLRAEPKDVARGVTIFKRIVDADPNDYWAHVLYGGCLFWSGRPADALAPLARARAIDPQRPHGYSVGAQCLKGLRRGPEAVALVCDLFDQPTLKLEEPDHFDKLVEAVQVAADELLPEQAPRYQALVATASTLYPAMAPRFAAVRKQGGDGCCVQ